MIKTKSRSCKGVRTAKNSHKLYMQDMTIILVTKFAMFNFGAQGCNVKSASPKIKHCKLKRLEKT